ncbi:hypothetical protein [Streptomyces albidoflavus]|uniref:hypothetical protein n=1 Tax=Streptomyces albidoflavus TaxID=1886 RepID=UPI002148016E|nr:hypothetical protein [Streptomyces albidoflavus]MCR0989360.1 hypothetical protein [Streptomyces albidoflavus]
MTDSAVGAGVLGRWGIVSLAGEALGRPPQEERPVTVLLGPRGSGASETHSALMERYGPSYPFAYLRFAPGQALLPRYALGLLARQLERRLPQYRRMSFPLLTLGLLASDEDLSMTSLEEGRRSIQQWLRHFQQQAENRYGDYLAAFFEVAGGAIGAPEGASTAALALLNDALRRGRRRLPGGNRLGQAAYWYGAHPLTRAQDRWEALTELNSWRHRGHEEDRDRLDRILFSAFLEDLRRGAAPSFSPRSFLLLLDQTDTRYGRRFLDLLLRARHDDTVVASGPCDPLTVVASCNRWLPRWGPASGEQWPWQLRVPDGASLEDWRAHRPPRDGEDTWWYPIRLRDLQQEEVHTLVEKQLHTHPGLSPFTRLTPFIHRLTGGLPKGVSQVLQALQQADGERAPGPAQERWLRTLPDRIVLVGEEQRTLADAALDSLLDGFDDRERDRLAECAAAPDLYVGTQVLGYGEALFTQLRIRRLIDGPGAFTPALHPWLRRLLLWKLAARPSDWEAAHDLLAEHAREAGRTPDRMYHLLATGRLEEVTDHLLSRFDTLPATTWISELEKVTAAPNRLASVGGPLELLATLAPPEPGGAVTGRSVVRGLVAARWLWSDPLADPGMRLGHVLADGFIQLSRLGRSDNVALLNESERYLHWRPSRTTTNGS